MTKIKESLDIRKLTYIGLLTALVVVLQLAGSFIRFGMFSISLVLVPIVIGVAVCGIGTGAWLGFVFGLAVLLSGDAAGFMQYHVFGTILTVLAKGTLAGVGAGFIYKLLAKFNKYLATFVSAIACPIINTGIFLLGSRIFFYDTIIKMGAEGNGVSTVAYMFLFLVGGNFIFELVFNVVLSPAIVRIINIVDKKS